MKKLLKRGFSGILALIMVIGLLPITAFAAVDSSGRPKDVNNTLVLSMYIGDGFPGEPAVYGTSDYKNFDSNFKVKSGATFANSAKNQLDWDKINADIVQGTTSGSTSVWGVYDATGTKDYFLSNASIIQPANEAKMIRAIKTELKNASDAEVLAQYEIIWYVIKLQHNQGSGWWSSSTTEWHIDGVIKERAKISINYYGNGNTSGSAPLGIADHTSGKAYTVLSQNTMIKKINGVEVAFLGWSAKADGTGAEAGFYQPGDVIYPTESISLYAMWDTFTQHTATVNTYLDDVKMPIHNIHGDERVLSLSTDNVHFYDLTGGEDGVYTTNITGNGKFHVYRKGDDGTYTQLSTLQLTIYNQNGSLDIHHYSVNYNTDGGVFETEVHEDVYLDGIAVNAIDAVPTKEGYRFLGWETEEGALLQPGDLITASIDQPITLTAKWEQTVDITINVLINHIGGGGYDLETTRDDVTLELVSRADDNAPYLEIGHELTLEKNNHEGFNFKENSTGTRYTAQAPVYTDMPGGTVDYTVVTHKSGYDTTVEAIQDENGDWTINVEMTFNPNDFDLEFTVEVDESVPEQYLPSAAIVKILFWHEESQSWKIITQQEGNGPGVRVNIDAASRSGSGEYPVWKFISGTNDPYGYRIQVTAFVYPDGTIVPASKVLTENVAWTDNVYTATAQPVADGDIFGALEGAYFVESSDSQLGELTAVITMDLHDVIFDAQGGKVNGLDAQRVPDQYKIPAFSAYVPVRDGGYTFGGWYEDKACTVPATEGEDLTKETTLYAKWINPLTISGTVTISGTYLQNGVVVPVHEIDRADEAVVVLHEVRHGVLHEVDSMTVKFDSYTTGTGTADYAFEQIPNDGKDYRISILLLNYGTTYDNESDEGTSYTEEEYTAVFGGDNVADVDAYLKFEAPAFDQVMNVDATQIGEGFRPTGALSEVLYRDTGDNHPFKRISQHSVIPFGVLIGLDVGLGSGSQSIWKWHTNGTLYDYQMNITKLYGSVEGVFTEEGTEFNSDTAPYYISYDDPVHWDENTDSPTGEMKATLIPKQYLVSFDLNAGEDVVTGMDAYLNAETGAYQTTHKWSFDTAITAVPERAGYIFQGWQANVENVYVDGVIPANVYQEVVLTAQWVRDAYTVTAQTTTGGTTTGTGVYDKGATATVTAQAEAGYLFEGWYENGQLVSNDASYSFTVTGDRTLTAHFAPYKTITAIAQNGGTASGGGQFRPNASATLVAEAKDGYYFVGWYDENDELFTADATFTLTVRQDRTFTAKFAKKVSYKCDYVYLFGYNDAEIGATGPLLRGELAQMIYRLVKQNKGADHGNITFSDTEGEWYRTGISYMTLKGAIDQGKTYAYPEVQVTRGETYKMICLGLEFTTDTNLDYSDYAKILQNSGYLTNDGRVTATITRWEFCELFNAILGRSDYCTDGYYDTKGNEVTAETYGYTDLFSTDPYYRTMMIATSTFTGEKIDLEKRARRNPLDEYGE